MGISDKLTYVAPLITAPLESTLPVHEEGVLRVLELYKCIQGEGRYVGYPSVLLRFSGCTVGCSWCDTKHSWKSNSKLSVPTRDVVRQVADLVDSAAIEHLIISGGEPMEQPPAELYSLMMAHHKLMKTVETSGVVLPNAEFFNVPNTLWSLAPKLSSAGTHYGRVALRTWLTRLANSTLPMGQLLQIKFVVNPEDAADFEMDLDEIHNQIDAAHMTMRGVLVMFQMVTPNTGHLPTDLAVLAKRAELMEHWLLSDAHPVFSALQRLGAQIAIRFQNHVVVHGHKKLV